MQGNVDCALAAFVAKHKLDLSAVFHSSEWEDVLEAVNQGPLPPLNEYYNGSVPAVLLARASIHLLNARAAAIAAREAHSLRGPHKFLRNCTIAPCVRASTAHFWRTSFLLFVR